MAVNRIESELEAERAYWEARLANLEMLLCEVLIKNERLRREREMFMLTQPDPGSILAIS